MSRASRKAPAKPVNRRKGSGVAAAPAKESNVRALLVLFAMVVVVGLLLARASWLQLLDADFLEAQGDARHQRSMTLAAHRGMMLDRHGEPLAVSVPVDSIWMEPRRFEATDENFEQLGLLLRMSPETLKARVMRRKNAGFMWLKRRMEPFQADQVIDAQLKGVHARREYRRFYPTAEVNGHLLGYTDIDDKGQEGLEKAYEDWLRGEPGKARVMKDRSGRPVAELDGYIAPREGKSLKLTLDRRIQFLAYRALKRTVQAHDAKGGTVVLVDVPTGGILALANQPAFNPNDRSSMAVTGLRNRSLTDVFEPGSTIKPFVIATALDEGLVKTDTIIDTSPGWMMVGRKRIKDHRNYGKLDIGGVLRKSSNMGATKMAMSMSKEDLWTTYDKLGFGHITATNFPGERRGVLPHFADWQKISQATMSYGYGLSVTAVQLAQAYTVLAAGGVMRELSFVSDEVRYTGNEKRIFSEQTAYDVVAMLDSVVQGDGGTGRKAQIDGYRVAGKTGTAHKVSAKGGYDRDRYLAVFAGMAPSTNPRIVAIVVVDEPGRSQVYGGQVAAPLFADVARDALRLLNVRPDKLPGMRPQWEIEAEQKRLEAERIETARLQEVRRLELEAQERKDEQLLQELLKRQAEEEQRQLEAQQAPTLQTTEVPEQAPAESPVVPVEDTALIEPVAMTEGEL